MSFLPLVIEPEILEKQLGNEKLLIVDLCKPEVHLNLHIPGAVHLDYIRIVRIEKPVMGLLPEPSVINEVLSSIGFTPEHHVVAYDDEGGGKACRLLWTLSACGYEQYSLLNGGINAWANERHPVTRDVTPLKNSHCDLPCNSDEAVADKKYIMNALGNPDIRILDARTTEEFTGQKRFAEKAGHIPGAKNLDWLLTMDQGRNLRLKPENELRDLLAERGLSPEKETIVYCQSHHRSAHSYIMLKSLGFERVRGYPGSWSDWGNASDTPVE